MKKWEIDINCDVGEGLENEARLFPYISSCNLACGGHAGNEETMRKVISLALIHHVKIGAHPSYPDRENFGRKSMKMKPDDFKFSLLSQVRELEGLIREKGALLTHIKAHGALYNDLARDRQLSKYYLDVLEDYKSQIFLYVPYGSVLAEEAEISGFRYLNEAFGDRNYENDLSLVSRSCENALITGPEDVLEHLLRMIKEGEVKTINGSLRKIKAQTFCIHGDTASAYEILTYLSNEFPKHNIHLKK